jgi:hypothetical protein
MWRGFRTELKALLLAEEFQLSYETREVSKEYIMYNWVVYLHVIVIFVFLIQHAVEIFVSFKLREQKEPEGIFATYEFMLPNNTRNLRITYLLIMLTGMAAGFIATWWKQGWIWTALGVMMVIWIVMSRLGPNYLTAVDEITNVALKNKDDGSAIDRFRSDLKARREPEIMITTSLIGGLIILWLMIFRSNSKTDYDRA